MEASPADDCRREVGDGVSVLRSGSSSLGAAVVLAAVASMGCGGGGGADAGGGGADAGPGAGLVGRWGAACIVPPPETTECDFEWTFAAVGSASVVMRSVKDSGSSAGFGGCTITLRATGYRWSATYASLTVAATPSTAATVSQMSCDDPSDDLAEAPDPDFNPSSFAIPDQPYTLSENHLIIGPGTEHTLTRR